MELIAKLPSVSLTPVSSDSGQIIGVKWIHLRQMISKIALKAGLQQSLSEEHKMKRLK